MLQAKLVVVGGDAKETEIKLKLPAVIGRGREATVALPHPLVSRQHCEITEFEGQLVVRDLGSLNGTFVNSQRIEGEVLLPPGELLTVGTVTFRAVYGDADNSSIAPNSAVRTRRAADETLRDRGGAAAPAPASSPEVIENVDFEFVDDVEPIDAADLEFVSNDSTDSGIAAPQAFAHTVDDSLGDTDIVEIIDDADAIEIHDETSPSPQRSGKAASDSDLNNFLRNLE